MQREVAHALGRPLGRQDRMRRECTQIAEAYIRPNDRLTSFERLQIYGQQYWWRLCGAFTEDFRGLHAILGQRRFDRLATAYLSAFGSRSWNLRDLGQHLEGFMASHPELTAPRTALAFDMVRVEWANVVAFDGPEKACLDPGKLAGLSPRRIRMGLQPYITLLELRHPVDHLLKKLKDANLDSPTGTAPRRPRLSRKVTAAAAHPSLIHLVVHRLDWSVYYKRIDAEAFRLLSILQSGETLEGACSSLLSECNASNRLAGKIQAWFADWMRFGWLCER